MRLGKRLTPLRAWCKVQAMSAWSVKTRRAPSRQCRDVRVYGHTTTAMHSNEYPPPRPCLKPDFLSVYCLSSLLSYVLKLRDAVPDPASSLLRSHRNTRYVFNIDIYSWKHKRGGLSLTLHLCCIAHKKNIFFADFAVKSTTGTTSTYTVSIFPVGHSVILL